MAISRLVLPGDHELLLSPLLSSSFCMESGYLTIRGQGETERLFKNLENESGNMPNTTFDYFLIRYKR